MEDRRDRNKPSNTDKEYHTEEQVDTLFGGTHFQGRIPVNGALFQAGLSSTSLMPLCRRATGVIVVRPRMILNDSE